MCSLKQALAVVGDGKIIDLGPVVQSPISANPGLTLNETYRVNSGLALIGL